MPSLLNKISYQFLGPDFGILSTLLLHDPDFGIQSTMILHDPDLGIQSTMLLHDLQNIFSDSNITEDGLFLLLLIRRFRFL